MGDGFLRNLTGPRCLGVAEIAGTWRAVQIVTAAEVIIITRANRVPQALHPSGPPRRPASITTRHRRAAHATGKP